MITNPTWVQSFVGRYARETWTREDGLFKVEDRSAGWGRCCARPYIIEQRQKNGTFLTLRYDAKSGRKFGYYATAESAMAIVDKMLPMESTSVEKCAIS